MKKAMWILAILMPLFMVQCATMKANQEAAQEGVRGEVELSQADAFRVALTTLSNEGYVPKAIHQEYFIATFEPKTMQSSRLMKMLDVPGAWFVASSRLNEEINLHCSVTPIGEHASELKITAAVYSVTTPGLDLNVGFRPRSEGTSREYNTNYSAGTAKYYFEKIVEACKRPGPDTHGGLSP